jgi:phosphohistidine phosphatase
MDLYLLRHTDAMDLAAVPGARDEARPLSPSGETKADRINRAFRRLKLSFDLILSSPAVRARQTAERVSKQLGVPAKVRLTPNLGLRADPGAIIAELSRVRPAPQQVLLVGHEPHLSRLASLLLAGDGKLLSLRMKRGGLCRLSVADLVAGRCAGLEWLLSPRLFRRIAGKK